MMSQKNLIKKTVDFSYCLVGLLWSGGSSLLFGLLTLALCFSEEAAATATVLGAFLLLFFIPVTVYYIVRMVWMFRRAEDYELCTAVYQEVQNAPISLWRSCYFAIRITRPDGSETDGETSAVFKFSCISDCYFGNYINQPLQVLYDPKNGSVLVLKKQRLPLS